MMEQNNDGLVKDISCKCKAIVAKVNAGEKIKQAPIKVILTAIIVGVSGGGTLARGNFWDDAPR